jgi:hypothetical protein
MASKTKVIKPSGDPISGQQGGLPTPPKTNDPFPK